MHAAALPQQVQGPGGYTAGQFAKGKAVHIGMLEAKVVVVVVVGRCCAICGNSETTLSAENNQNISSSNLLPRICGACAPEKLNKPF